MISELSVDKQELRANRQDPKSRKPKLMHFLFNYVVFVVVVRSDVGIDFGISFHTRFWEYRCMANNAYYKGNDNDLPKLCCCRN